MRQRGAERKLAPIIWWRISLVWSKVLPHLGCNDEGEEGSTPSQEFGNHKLNLSAQAESNLTQHLDSPTGGKTGISCDEMTSRLFDHQSFQMAVELMCAIGTD
jgi:hypothetical protein